MSLFHINPKTLVSSPCKAQTAACPFGAALHYTSVEAAQAAAETMAKEPQALTKKRPNKEIVASVVKSNGVPRAEAVWLNEQKSWTKNEHGVLTLLEECAWAKKKPITPERKQELMSKITGLHFAKEMLSDKEQRMLYMLEKIQKEWLAK